MNLILDYQGRRDRLPFLSLGTTAMPVTVRFGSLGVALAAMAGVQFAASAHAAVGISTAQTQYMSCAKGICAPTAGNAVLNAGDLESYLAAGNLEITTTGSRGVQANNIWVK